MNNVNEYVAPHTMMMPNFLQQVADDLIHRFGWEGLKDVVLVFPMHRAGVIMRSELQKMMVADQRAALWAPRMLALNDLFDSLCPLGKEDELFTICRLHRIYTECLHEQEQTSELEHQNAHGSSVMEIDRFYGWGKQLLSDFTNIDQGISEQEIDSFFRNALTLSDLDTYKLDEDVRRRLEDLLYKGEANRQSLIAKSVQAHFAALWHAMPDIYHRLRDELKQAGKGYEGQRQRYVTTHWNELRSRAGARVYCFVGFNYLLPVEKQLMKHLHDEGRALFYWDYVEGFRTNTKAFAFIRRNMEQLPNALPAAVWGAPRRVRTINATSLHSEAGYAGRWLQQTYQTHGGTTAVVICDEGQLEPIIYSIPLIKNADGTVEDINITKGYPLRNTPIFAEIVKLLEKLFRGKNIVVREVLQHAIAFVDEQSALSLATQQNTWQWHLQREALYQTRRAFQQFITILDDSLVSDLALHPELLRRLIVRHLEQQTLPFHGEPVTDVQVMGVLETRTLDFQHLLLMNVEEGVIPAHQPDQSFLPYYLRKSYGLQTHDERASVYAYNFFRLLHRAGDVTLLFSQSQTAMTKKSMSRFVMQMLVCPEEFIVDKFTLTESNTLQPAKTVEVTAGAGWLSVCRQAGRKLQLSPSAINTFYACKRRFYLEYMLGLREEDEQDVIFSNRTLGLFVHEAVHYLYEHHCKCDNTAPVHIYPNQVETMDTPERRQEALRVAYERMNADYMRRHDTHTPVYIMEQHELENRVIDTYIEHALARDRYDAEHRGLTILLLEQPMYTTVRAAMADGNEVVVSIGGRVDRMDRIGGQNGMPAVTRIVDYKCGTYNAKKMNASSDDLRTPEKPDADYVRQTLLYSHVAYSDAQQGDSANNKLQEDKQNRLHRSIPINSIEPHLYFASRDLTDARTITRVSLDKSPIVYDHDTCNQFGAYIQGMVEDVLSERTFDQCQTCPTYCPFLQLCGRKATKY